MIRHPFYQYGSIDNVLPINLNFGEFILQKLEQFKDRTFVNGLTDESMSYGDIAHQSMSLGVSLSKLRVKPRHTVAICSENRMEYIVAAIGSICIGATFTAFNFMYTKHELTHVANISKPTYLICSPMAYKQHEKTFRSLKYIEKIIVFGDERPPNTISFNDLVTAHDVKFEQVKVVDVDGASDTLFVMYSSGTTGLPKGVMLTHRNALVASTAKLAKSTADVPVVLTFSPWSHALGFIGIFLLLTKGNDVVYMPKFQTEKALQCIEKYKITNLHTVPTVLVALSKSAGGYDTSSVQDIYCGASPITKDILETVNKTFPNAPSVYQAYGMTETTLGIIRDTGESPRPKLGSVGKVVEGTIIKVVDIETKQLLGPDEPGEICVKGGTVMKGYVGKDRREDFDEEGFFRTGDVGYYDRDGYFFIVDRLKELIKYNAYQVSPAEIEAVLLQHPAVRDAGVVGVPDARAGEVPRAFVALQPGASVSADELQRFVAERLSNPKHLRGGVRFVPEVPKSPNGKILRRELKAMLESKL